MVNNILFTQNLTCLIRVSRACKLTIRFSKYIVMLIFFFFLMKSNSGLQLRGVTSCKACLGLTLDPVTPIHTLLK